jgi:hypothetical protein
LPTRVALTLDSWIVMHEDMRGSPRVRALFDHLANALGAYARTSTIRTLQLR